MLMFCVLIVVQVLPLVDREAVNLLPTRTNLIQYGATNPLVVVTAVVPAMLLRRWTTIAPIFAGLNVFSGIFVRYRTDEMEQTVCSLVMGGLKEGPHHWRRTDSARWRRRWWQEHHTPLF